MQWWEKLPIQGVYEVQTDLGADVWQLALAEVERCTERHSLDTEYTPGLDTVAVMAQGPATQQVLVYFTSDRFYQDLVNLCLDNREWCTNWGQPSVEWFRRNTSFAHVWHGAPPNYTRHEWHVDCLRTVAHGMMYMSPQHDGVATTLFREKDLYRDSGAELSITTGFDRGWAILQNGRQIHRGINLHPVYRYTFKWMLTLNL